MSGSSIERLLDKIEQDISNYLIFVGVLDNNAKLLSYRRGKASFSLPLERHDTLDVQLSLMFSLIKQLEDISGNHRFTISRFVNHDIFLFGLEDNHIFVITSGNSDPLITKKLTELVSSSHEMQPRVTSTMTNGGKEQTMAPAATSHMEITGSEAARRFSQPTIRPEAILLLQGYFMALESNWSVEDGGGGFYKIKGNDRDTRLSWATLEKISSSFKNRVDIHNIGTDPDGRIYVTISIK